MEFTVKTAAKLNLSLDITGRLPDGFHEISTVMQTVGVYDYLTMTQIEEGIELSGNLPYLPYNAKNLVYKAAAAFYARIGQKPGLRVRIQKHIPVQAGLGGGSGNAAGVLAGLNAMYGSPLSEEELSALAGTLGADVPFFLTGGTVLCRGRGEQMEKLPDLPDCAFVICKGGLGISTKAAYAALDAAPFPEPMGDLLIAADRAGDIKEIAASLGNAFWSAAKELCPPLVPMERNLRRYCDAVMLTGSGSAMYALFPDVASAKPCFERLRKKYGFVYLARPVGAGCQIFQAKEEIK